MKENYLIVVAQMKCTPGMEQRAREELSKLIEPTRKEEGCIKYDLHISSSDPTEFMFYEIWTDQAALDQHRQTEHLVNFRACRGEFLVGQPQVSLWHLA